MEMVLEFLRDVLSQPALLIGIMSLPYETDVSKQLSLHMT